MSKMAWHGGFSPGYMSVYARVHTLTDHRAGERMTSEEAVDGKGLETWEWRVVRIRVGRGEAGFDFGGDKEAAFKHLKCCPGRRVSEVTR